MNRTSDLQLLASVMLTTTATMTLLLEHLALLLSASCLGITWTSLLNTSALILHRAQIPQAS